MKAPRRPQYCAAIIERADSAFLVAQPKEQTAVSQWIFPRGRAGTDESAEAAMRRIAHEQLGVFVELVVGQPPLPVLVDGVASEIRYFFCGIAGGQPRAGPYNQLRWVTKRQLGEIDLDDSSRQVADWLLAAQ